jgi:hypothetical protein
MLSQLIRLLEQNEGEVDLVAVGRQLNAHPSAVAGMLETLARKGRVVEIGADCGVCDSCALSSHCTLPGRRVKRYEIVRPTVPHERTAA